MDGRTSASSQEPRDATLVGSFFGVNGRRRGSVGGTVGRSARSLVERGKGCERRGAKAVVALNGGVVRRVVEFRGRRRRLMRIVPLASSLAVPAVPEAFVSSAVLSPASTPARPFSAGSVMSSLVLGGATSMVVLIR
eukprot:scaffold10255_cov52-Attheya_sp.AAC.3